MRVNRSRLVKAGLREKGSCLRRRVDVKPLAFVVIADHVDQGMATGVESDEPDPALTLRVDPVLRRAGSHIDTVEACRRDRQVIGPRDAAIDGAERRAVWQLRGGAGLWIETPQASGTLAAEARRCDVDAFSLIRENLSRWSGFDHPIGTVRHRNDMDPSRGVRGVGRIGPEWFCIRIGEAVFANLLAANRQPALDCSVIRHGVVAAEGRPVQCRLGFSGKKIVSPVDTACGVRCPEALSSADIRAAERRRTRPEARWDGIWKRAARKGCQDRDRRR